MLNSEKEVELRVFENEHFMLQKDWKYNEGDMSTLYCLAIVKNQYANLKTVRDLKSEHLPMLKSIRDDSMRAIEQKFGVDKVHIKSYFHYQPTYYHLHIHFVHVECAHADDVRVFVDLDSVIQNIEMMDDYYQRATLSYPVGTQMPLFKILAEKGILQEEKEKKPETPKPAEKAEEEVKKEDQDTKKE